VQIGGYDFTYAELSKHLNVSNNLINAARKHARIYGEDALISPETIFQMIN